MPASAAQLRELKKTLKGSLLLDELTRVLYATDASVYREQPLAVAYPKGIPDVGELVRFAASHGVGLLPRGAGTSLGGQVVGEGIVMDFTGWNEILEVNQQERWARVQPGVVLDDLNLHLRRHGLFFAPETSTSNRCQIGGMVGNNSCGAHSILYGSTRDHLLEAKVILSDGSLATLRPYSMQELQLKMGEQTFEGNLYRHLSALLSEPSNAGAIRAEFPKPSVRRRNTGYALDLLLECGPFTEGGPPLNLCRLLAGSEGTLAIGVEFKLALEEVPPPHTSVVVVHLDSVAEAARANLIALRHEPGAVELIDHHLLECAAKNPTQSRNASFVKGEPGALLIVEFQRHNPMEIEAASQQMQQEMREAELGYHFATLNGPAIRQVWDLRKAGLGTLSNFPGDPKPVACIEDTAVDVQDLPSYLQEIEELLDSMGLDCVFYAHIGDGEIHLRPVLDLKDEGDRQKFRDVTHAVAGIVKRYQGSFSGEHGDGRVRAPFLRFMVGQHNYELLYVLKKAWDPAGIFNPGKIVDAAPMDASLRYEPAQETRQFATVLDFGSSGGILRMAERCNGSGDCRKSPFSGGTMCPSYMATLNERHTTRARANALRELLTRSPRENPFSHRELHEVMDLCVSCKGCRTECPSNVDMARLKAEFLQQYHDANGAPLRTLLMGHFAQAGTFNARFPGLVNLLFTHPVLSRWLKDFLRIEQKRKLPALSPFTFRSWLRRNRQALQPYGMPKGKVHLFVDEFTNFHEAVLGVKTVELLTALGFEVIVPEHADSARSLISKGFLRKARHTARRNVEMLGRIVSAEAPLIGIEPSAILGFRDEYRDLVGSDLRDAALALAENCFLFDEWLSGQITRGTVYASAFTSAKRRIKLHGHCHQKALSSVDATARILRLPSNYTVDVIPSGCCGMAGAFGYEREHYDISMRMGELVLFPAIREAKPDVLIAAPGMSCRHQIRDGTGREALHPIEILHQAKGLSRTAKEKP